MATSRDQVAATLHEVFPVRAELFSYEFVHMAADGRVTFRLVVWEKDPAGALSIRDVKEQELFLFDPALLEGDTPILEFLRGWAEALSQVFANATVHTVETLMPHDLAPGNAVMLRRAKTAADYRAAILGKSRLGKFMK